MGVEVTASDFETVRAWVLKKKFYSHDQADEPLRETLAALARIETALNRAMNYWEDRQALAERVREACRDECSFDSDRQLIDELDLAPLLEEPKP